MARTAASFPIPVPAGECLTGGASLDIQLAGLRRHMAAVVRGGHARQGGGGGRRPRGGGRGNGGAPADPEPAQVLNPVGFQWTFWKEGNTNTSKKSTKDIELEIKIYKELENNPKIDQDELNSYGVSAVLLEQEEGVVRMLHEVVTIYNRMATTRRRYLYKKKNGVWGKEMSLMLKKIANDTQLALGLLEDIQTAGGFAPPAPKVFDDLPKLK